MRPICGEVIKFTLDICVLQRRDYRIYMEILYFDLTELAKVQYIVGCRCMTSSLVRSGFVRGSMTQGNGCYLRRCINHTLEV